MKNYSKYFLFNCTILFMSILIYHYYTNALIPTPSVDPYYDYIIVGGGTAGCVIAALLSEKHDLKVLLVEAGDEFGFLSKIPLTPTMIQRGSNDWSFVTTPQKYSSFGLNDKRQFIPRGKGLGGSGQMNYFLHSVTSSSDYESWTKLGARGWNYTVMKPYFDRIFMHDYIESKMQNKNPIIRITNIDNCIKEITKIYMKASRQLSKFKLTVTAFFNTIYNGKRESSFEKYLVPALSRKNLHVLTNTLVSKVHFKHKKAQSVEIILSNNETQIISTKKEIIVSCGSLKTPQLLMLSGIGPKAILEKHNLKLIVDAESVGKNLHDHLNLPLYISIKKPISVTLNKIMKIKTIYNYLLHGKGYISSSAIAAIGKGPNNTSLTLFALGSADETILREIANTKSDTFRAFFPLHLNKSQEGFIFLANCLQPLSRGTVTLQDTNPHSPPIIDPNYLSNQKDIKCTTDAIRLAINVIEMKAFKDIGAVIHWPMLKECQHLWSEKIHDNFLMCITRVGALTGHHSAGTCSMAGNPPVVDDYLRVRGVAGIRIVDASVLPTPVSSSTNSLIIAIAERIVDSILNENKL